MSEPCQHTKMRSVVLFLHGHNGQKRVVLSVSCHDCGAPFRFAGAGPAEIFLSGNHQTLNAWAVPGEPKVISEEDWHLPEEDKRIKNEKDTEVAQHKGKLRSSNLSRCVTAETSASVKGGRHFPAPKYYPLTPFTAIVAIDVLFPFP